MALEVVKLEESKYWIDFDKDGKVQGLETIIVHDNSNPEEELLNFGNQRLSQNCRDKIKLYTSVTLYSDSNNYLNSSFDAKYRNIVQLRSIFVGEFQESINALNAIILSHNLKDDHPYVKLKQDLEDQIKVLREIRIRFGSFDKLYPDNPRASGAYAAYNADENTLDINSENKGSKISISTIIHELDHAITFQSAKKWEIPTQILIGDKLSCEILVPSGHKEIRPTLENATIKFELDFPTPTSKPNLSFNSVFHYHGEMPRRLSNEFELEEICQPDIVHENRLIFETKAHQAAIRYNLFRQGIDPNVFIDLESKDEGKRDKAIDFLMNTFSLNGSPQDKDYLDRNYWHLNVLHYFGLGIQQDNQLHDLYEFLAWPGGPYAKLPDVPGCKSNELPDLK